MKWLATLLVLLASLTTNTGSQRVRPSASVDLVGRVSDWQGCVLPDVTITVTSAAGSTLGTAKTDGNGDFRLTGLTRGMVTVRAESPGWGRAESRQSLAPGQNLWDTGLVLGRLAPGGSHSITGQVLSADGTPIPHATVSLLSVFDPSVPGQVRTNANGNYVITATNPGQYILTAVKCNYEVAVATAIFELDDNAGATVNFRLQKGRPCP